MLSLGTPNGEQSEASGIVTEKEILHYPFGSQAVSQSGFREFHRRFQAKNEGYLTNFLVMTQPVRSGLKATLRSDLSLSDSEGMTVNSSC